MESSFQAEIAAWNNFYMLLGAAAALMGLLFVALSLRLGIFRQHQQDIQASSALAFATHSRRQGHGPHGRAVPGSRQHGAHPGRCGGSPGWPQRRSGG
ncbi:MAG: hypothetical protein R2853_14725 [Thermomicrobiales bacterium]